MIAKTTFAVAQGRREPIARARSITAMLGGAILASMIGALCVARMALAEPAALTPSDFEGRWVSQGTKLTLDISRCGEDWCGVIVADNACGYTALRANDRSFDQALRPLDRPELIGKLQLAANAEPYGVIVSLSREKSGSRALFVAGHSGGTFAAFRRTYDYKELLVRGGDATCRSDPKQS